MKIRTDVNRHPYWKPALVFMAFAVVGFYVWLLHWLMPVAIPSRLSADHLRWVFADPAERAAVVPHSLNALWLLVLSAARMLGLSELQPQLVAWSAAISAGILLASLVFLGAVYRRLPRPDRQFQNGWRSRSSLGIGFFLLAFAPIVLWTAVIPNGLVLSFLFIALLSCGRFTSRFTYPLRVIEGFAAGLTPAAWGLSIALALGARQSGEKFTNSQKIIGFLCLIGGLALHPTLKFAVEGIDKNSVSWLPVFDSIRAVRFEDVMSGPLILLGPVGESATGLIASVVFSVFILALWLGLKPIRLILLCFPFLLPFSGGHARAWKMAHPGWNTVLEDWALNIERGLEAPTVVLVDRLSEESILRFVQALKLTATKSGAPRALKESRRSFLVPVLRRNFFDAELVERVQATFPSYSVAEAKQASSLPTDEMKARFRDAREMFFRACLVPNVLRGIPFFVGPEFVSSLEVPGHTVEVSHRYLMNGIRVTNSSADLKLRLVRENIKTGFVRARLGYREGQLSRAIEVDIYERYAIFHLAMASEYNLIMTPTDWQKRANVELYAALRKVPWLDEPYRIVCEAPENRIKSKLESNGNSQQTAAEPLDICKEIFKEKGVFGY